MIGIHADNNEQVSFRFGGMDVKDRRGMGLHVRARGAVWIIKFNP